jgi:hypothetical protein
MRLCAWPHDVRLLARTLLGDRRIQHGSQLVFLVASQELHMTTQIKVDVFAVTGNRKVSSSFPLRLLGAAALLALSGCAAEISAQDGALEESVAGTETSALPTSSEGERGRRAGLNGWWRTDGYGFVMEVRDDQLRLWQVTKTTCAPSYTGVRSGSPSGGEGAAFELDAGIRLTIRPGATRDRRLMRTEGSITDWGLERISSLPSACNVPSPADPLLVFDVLWTTYAENYPFAEAKGVDWNRQRDAYRSRVRADTTPGELFEILSAMIRPLHDMHTHILTDVGTYDGWRPDTAPYTQALLDRFTQIVEQRDVGTPLATWGNGSVGFAELPGGIGYLRISAFDFGTNDADADAVEMDRALDAIFTEERTAAQRGLILDVRVSVGGHNPLGLQVASRLTRRPYAAYAVEARRPEPSEYTGRQTAWVRPHRGPVYAGPVVLLTSRYTVSAHETFTQSLLGRRPEVIRIGENTQGAISDHMFRSLPNGWIFSLPNQRFYTNGVAYDGAGVPPTLPVAVLTPDEMARGEDAAFDRALAVLRVGGNSGH